MEQASVYRRAMAPVAIVVGLIGLAATGLAQTVDWAGPGRFAGYWLGVAFVAAMVALLLIRQQALSSKEDFWSPPTRHVAQALIPLLTAGLGLGLLEILNQPDARDSIRLTALWIILYGGALHAAGFFMRRGIRLLGWIFVIIGSLCLCFHELEQTLWLNGKHAHLLMGWAFGANNLMYGLYLKLTSEPLDSE
ncbi:hypothetical protein OAF50_01730 [bacterium]|nr:hypothetical protein [bacterium]